MKNILSIAFFLMEIAVFAQVCVPKGISTDPFTGVNPQTPTRLNKFDWQSIKTRNPVGPQYLWPVHRGGANLNWSNPFFSLNDYLKPIAADDQSDFYPKDGWELIKRDLGYLEDEVTPRVADPSVYYVVLYNRYSGVIRVFASSIGFNGGASYVRVGIKYDNLALDGTANNIPRLFNFYSTVAKPVDELDISEKDAMITNYTNSPSVPGNFLFADFQLAYDPCICGIPGDLRFKFSRIISSNINLSGRMLGVSVPLINTSTGEVFGDNLGEDFLSSVYNTGTGTSVSSGVGMMTFSSIRDYAEKYAAEVLKNTPGYDGKTSQSIEDVSKMVELAGSAADKDSSTSGHESYFKAITTVLSFFSTESDKGESTTDVPPMPWGISAEVALTGACTTDVPQSDIDIVVGIPGSSGASTKQELASATVSAHPMYNESLGAFAVLETPQVEMFYQNTQTSSDQAYDHRDYKECDNWAEYQIYSQSDIKGFRVAQMPKIMINPTFHPNIPNCSIKAAWGIEHSDGDQYTSLPYSLYSSYLSCMASTDPQCTWKLITDYGFTMPNYPYNSSFSVLSDYFLQTDRKNNKTTYIGNFVPLEGFDKMMPKFQMGYYTGHLSNHYDNAYKGIVSSTHYCNWHPYEDTPVDFPNPNGGGQFTMYIWLLVRLESTDLNRFGQPNSTTTLLKLPVNISNQITGAANYNSFFANNLPYDYTLGTSSIASNTTYKALHDIIVNGNITVGTGSKLILDAGNTVVMTPESVVSGEVEMNTGKSQLGTPWSPYDVSNSVSSWCLSKRHITLSANTREDGMDNAPEIQTNGMTVFPNPTAFNATIRYTLAENSEVNVYVSDMYGSKVINMLSSSSQLEGQYSVQVNTHSLSSGTYLCVMEANGEKHVQRLLVVK